MSVARSIGAVGLLAAVVLAGAAAWGSQALPAEALPEPAPAPSPEPAVAEQAATETIVEAAEAAGDPAAPRRIMGTAGADLNAAMAAAGVPERIAADYLRALASRIALAGGISIADRFDLVIAGGPGAEQLLYAGLDRVGASDVQLMRWESGGRSGWTDAEGNAEGGAMAMPIAARVSSSFGMRNHPVLGSHRFHRGVDLKAVAGTPIRAAAAGRVASAGWHGGYGRQVVIGHGDGLTTRYAHMSRIAAAPGDRVSRGQVIGYVGSTGLSTGPHLHYEVLLNGRPVNPLGKRYAGGESMDRDERRAFNARLRTLLTANGKG